jgi:hypothetical protein
LAHTEAVSPYFDFLGHGPYRPVWGIPQKVMNSGAEPCGRGCVALFPIDQGAVGDAKALGDCALRQSEVQSALPDMVS